MPRRMNWHAMTDALLLAAAVIGSMILGTGAFAIGLLVILRWPLVVVFIAYLFWSH